MRIVETPITEEIEGVKKRMKQKVEEEKNRNSMQEKNQQQIIYLSCDNNNIEQIVPKFNGSLLRI